MINQSAVEPSVGLPKGCSDQGAYNSHRRETDRSQQEHGSLNGDGRADGAVGMSLYASAPVCTPFPSLQPPSSGIGGCRAQRRVSRVITGCSLLWRRSLSPSPRYHALPPRGLAARATASKRPRRGRPASGADIKLTAPLTIRTGSSEPCSSLSLYYQKTTVKTTAGWLPG